MKRFGWLITCGVLTVCTGCNQLTELPKALKSATTAAVPPEAPAVVNTTGDEEVKLAQLVLKPKRHELSVTNDPFKPLLGGANLDALADGSPIEGELLDDIQFLGLIKIGDTSSALLKVFEDKGIYKVDDQIKQWTISEINPEYVLLKKDDKVLKLKRGDK